MSRLTHIPLDRSDDSPVVDHIPPTRAEILALACFGVIGILVPVLLILSLRHH